MATKKSTAKKDDFQAKKESIIEKCTQAGVFQSYINEIESTKNDKELSKVMMANIELRPFAEE